MKDLSDQFKGHVANGVSFPKSILPWWHWCEVIICSLGCLKCSSGWICTHTYIYKYVYIYTHIIHILCLCILHICTYFLIYIYYTHNICSIQNILQKSLNNFFFANPIFPCNYSDDTPSIPQNIPSQYILHPYKSKYYLPASSKHYISYLKAIKVSNYGKVP